MTEEEYVKLSEAQLEQIAERAAEKVISTVQMEIGKSALRALLYVGGAMLAAIVAYLSAHGWIKL